MIQNLVQKYRTIKAPVKASLWFLICGFLQKGISMITTPIFTRVMTDVEYGRFSVYNSWLSIVQIIVSLNLAAGVYTRGLVKNEANQKVFTSSMLGLSSTCIFVWFLIYALFHDFFNAIFDLSSALMVAMFLEIWATAAYQFWSNRERVNYRYRKLVALTLTYVVARPIFGILMILRVNQNHQTEARVFTATAVDVILFAALYFSMMRQGKKFYDKAYWLYALKFNLPLVLHYLSQIVLSQSDRLMIHSFCGSAATAYYSVAYTLSMGLQILNSSISGTMNPWIYKSLRDGRASIIGKTSYPILMLIALCNFMVIAVAPEILTILAPASYQSALAVIPPVTMSVYFMFLYNLFATFEYYYEKTKYVMAASILGAIVNIVLNAIFIPRFGYPAAGYTTLVCYMLYAGAHYYFMKKVVAVYIQDEEIYNGRIIFGIGILLIGSGAIIMQFYSHIIIRYSVLVLCALILYLRRKSLQQLFVELKRKRG